MEILVAVVQMYNHAPTVYTLHSKRGCIAIPQCSQWDYVSAAFNDS